MSECIRRQTIPAFLVLIVSIPLTLGAAGSDDKPNIVLVLMDNFGGLMSELRDWVQRHGWRRTGML